MRGNQLKTEHPPINTFLAETDKHCCYLSILPSVGQETYIVKTQRSILLFFIAMEVIVKCVRPALEMEASKEEQRGVVRFLVAESAATRHKVNTPCNTVARNHPLA